MRVDAVEPEPTLRAKAQAAASLAPVPVEVHASDAEHLPVETGTVDAVVFCLVLCSVPDQLKALAEAKRALKPGGQIRFYEHVVAESGPGAGVLKALDTSGVWPKLSGGCHVSRDTASAITAAGFSITSLERFTHPRPGIPHILGVAEPAS